ncbi:MAG: esterase/lipase family protein [Gammaproteobacteria bacterium]
MPSDAIIFVPGIKGTKLVNTNLVNFDTIWSGIQSNFETIEDLKFSHAVEGQYYDEKIDSVIQEGEIEELAYSEFLHDLDTNKPVYIFNYDWRYSAAENGALLEHFLDYLIRKSEAAKGVETFRKFDFITHSLGNFVLRNYLRYNGFSKVNKIIFTVPPFQGSIDAASAVVIGEGVFTNVKAKVRKIIRTFPGALELLPRYKHASRFNGLPGEHNFFLSEHWQENITTPTKRSARETARKFRAALEVAGKTVQDELLDLAALTGAQRKRILVIARTGYDTYQSINVLCNKAGEPGNFFDFANACKTKNGDGRVPDISSCHYYREVLTLQIKDDIFYRDYSHGFVLKDERLQKIVNRFLRSGSSSFDWKIPGGTVKQVKGLQRKIQKKTGLPYWETVV